jgi:hypothetical protein
MSKSSNLPEEKNIADWIAYEMGIIYGVIISFWKEKSTCFE